MSKRNGNGSNGHRAGGRLPAGQSPAPVKDAPPLSEDEALAIANGAAISAYDFLVSRRAGDDDALPAGRFWYAGGVVDDGTRTAEHLAALKTFLLDHPGVPAAAAYLFMTRDVRRQRPAPWHELPLPLRQAYAVFASVLPLLVVEARAEAQRRIELQAPPATPLPNRQMFKRIDKRVSNKARRGKFTHDQKGHVAR
jgi:hypothetical protein